MNKEAFYIQEEGSSGGWVCGLSPDRFPAAFPAVPFQSPRSTNSPFAFGVRKGQGLDCFCSLSVRVDPAVFLIAQPGSISISVYGGEGVMFTKFAKCWAAFPVDYQG